MKDSGAMVRGLRYKAIVGTVDSGLTSVVTCSDCVDAVLIADVRVFVVILCLDPGVKREDIRIALARAHGSQNG